MYSRAMYFNIFLWSVQRYIQTLTKLLNSENEEKADESDLKI